MIAPLTLFSLVGLGIFYLQKFVSFPQVHLWLLSFLLFFVGLRPSLSLALSLALVMGLLQDSYATTPMGLHLGGFLVLVAAARFFRRRLLIQRIGSQVMASLAALILQEFGSRAARYCWVTRGFSWPKGAPILSAGDFAAPPPLGPLMYLLVEGLEKFLSRLGWHPVAESSRY